MRTPNEEIVQRGRDPATLFPVCRTVTRVWPWPVDLPPGVSVRDDEAKSGWTEFCGIRFPCFAFCFSLSLDGTVFDA